MASGIFHEVSILMCTALPQLIALHGWHGGLIVTLQSQAILQLIASTKLHEVAGLTTLHWLLNTVGDVHVLTRSSQSEQFRRPSARHEEFDDHGGAYFV